MRESVKVTVREGTGRATEFELWEEDFTGARIDSVVKVLLERTARIAEYLRETSTNTVAIDEYLDNHGNTKDIT